jgi:hypothetical protein
MWAVRQPKQSGRPPTLPFFSSSRLQIASGLSSWNTVPTDRSQLWLAIWECDSTPAVLSSSQGCVQLSETKRHWDAKLVHFAAVCQRSVYTIRLRIVFTLSFVLSKLCPAYSSSVFTRPSSMRKSGRRQQPIHGNGTADP